MAIFLPVVLLFVELFVPNAGVLACPNVNPDVAGVVVAVLASPNLKPEPIDEVGLNEILGFFASLPLSISVGKSWCI